MSGLWLRDGQVSFRSVVRTTTVDLRRVERIEVGDQPLPSAPPCLHVVLGDGTVRRVAYANVRRFPPGCDVLIAGLDAARASMARERHR